MKYWGVMAGLHLPNTMPKNPFLPIYNHLYVDGVISFPAEVLAWIWNFLGTWTKYFNNPAIEGSAASVEGAFCFGSKITPHFSQLPLVLQNFLLKVDVYDIVVTEPFIYYILHNGPNIIWIDI